MAFVSTHFSSLSECPEVLQLPAEQHLEEFDPTQRLRPGGAHAAGGRQRGESAPRAAAVGRDDRERRRRWGDEAVGELFAMQIVALSYILPHCRPFPIKGKEVKEVF